MEYETFAFWIGLPFAAAALMWVCYKIAVGKGRSGWWALLGLLHMVGIVVALGLESRRKPRKAGEGVRAVDGDSPGPDAETGDAVPGEPQAAAAKVDVAHMKRRWRARRKMKRPSDLLAAFLWHISVIMYLWAFIGPIMFLLGVYDAFLLGNPVTINGVKTQSIFAKLGLLAAAALFSAIGILYIVFYRRYLKRLGEVYDIRKRTASRDRSARRE